ncbi:MAG TPA: SsrA-binding protein [Acidimicrobiaceae bacterium]|nr:SsrA-binding protein [Acidimicrobiaceae bacterium]HAQ22380.1 SsrA-binding protein [Acidimicrobiaceae bacterium]HCV34514.1 SsrA-binding protein [Acidimicrobiaceae bacterium]|tara:strand:- start:1758 stop:2222 length:465 start_codon:yes stop_codon:yes gene_type:complete
MSERNAATNRRARHDYDLLDSWEAGLVLRGSEVKSIRQANVQISEAFGREQDGELWLIGMHVPPYAMSGSEATGHEPDRPRKLLLHRREIRQITNRMSLEGLTLVPLRLYFKAGNVKVEIALARGRKLHDRRQALARKEADREAERAMEANRRR